MAFNDVDFCVRVREAGYTNVFTPFAQLYHYESKSRGLDENPVKRKRFISEVERFQKRWAKQLAAGDPCMNPNFDLMKEDFSFDIKDRWSERHGTFCLYLRDMFITARMKLSAYSAAHRPCWTAPAATR